MVPNVHVLLQANVSHLIQQFVNIGDAHEIWGAAVAFAADLGAQVGF